MNIKKNLKMALAMTEKKEEKNEPAIKELIEKVFTTRSLVHFAHWNTHLDAAHRALGELYDGIVEEMDKIVEVYQGEFDVLTGLEVCAAKLEGSVVDKIQADADWLKQNKEKIANGSSVVANLLDNLGATYYQTLYKLKNLR